MGYADDSENRVTSGQLRYQDNKWVCILPKNVAQPKAYAFSNEPVIAKKFKILINRENEQAYAEKEFVDFKSDATAYHEVYLNGQQFPALNNFTAWARYTFDDFATNTQSVNNQFGGLVYLNDSKRWIAASSTTPEKLTLFYGLSHGDHRDSYVWQLGDKWVAHERYKNGDWAKNGAETYYESLKNYVQSSRIYEWLYDKLTSGLNPTYIISASNRRLKMNLVSTDVRVILENTTGDKDYDNFDIPRRIDITDDLKGEGVDATTMVYKLDQCYPKEQKCEWYLDGVGISKHQQELFFLRDAQRKLTGVVEAGCLYPSDQPAKDASLISLDGNGAEIKWQRLPNGLGQILPDGIRWTKAYNPIKEKSCKDLYVKNYRSLEAKNNFYFDVRRVTLVGLSVFYSHKYINNNVGFSYSIQKMYSYMTERIRSAFYAFDNYLEDRDIIDGFFELANLKVKKCEGDFCLAINPLSEYSSFIFDYLAEEGVQNGSIDSKFFRESGFESNYYEDGQSSSWKLMKSPVRDLPDEVKAEIQLFYDVMSGKSGGDDVLLTNDDLKAICEICEIDVKWPFKLTKRAVLNRAIASYHLVGYIDWSDVLYEELHSPGTLGVLHKYLQSNEARANYDETKIDCTYKPFKGTFLEAGVFYDEKNCTWGLTDKFKELLPQLKDVFVDGFNGVESGVNSARLLQEGDDSSHFDGFLKNVKESVTRILPVASPQNNAPGADSFDDVRKKIKNYATQSKYLSMGGPTPSSSIFWSPRVRMQYNKGFSSDHYRDRVQSSIQLQRYIDVDFNFIDSLPRNNTVESLDNTADKVYKGFIFNKSGNKEALDGVNKMYCECKGEDAIVWNNDDFCLDTAFSAKIADKTSFDFSFVQLGFKLWNKTHLEEFIGLRKELEVWKNLRDAGGGSPTQREIELINPEERLRFQRHAESVDEEICNELRSSYILNKINTLQASVDAMQKDEKKKTGRENLMNWVVYVTYANFAKFTGPYLKPSQHIAGSSAHIQIKFVTPRDAGIPGDSDGSKNFSIWGAHWIGKRFVGNLQYIGIFSPVGYAGNAQLDCTKACASLITLAFNGIPVAHYFNPVMRDYVYETNEYRSIFYNLPSLAVKGVQTGVLFDEAKEYSLETFTNASWWVSSIILDGAWGYNSALDSMKKKVADAFGGNFGRIWLARFAGNWWKSEGVKTGGNTAIQEDAGAD